MRNFFHSPLFRCLICLILVCCILVNVSPIRARAFAGLSLPALMYLLYAAVAGAVIIPPIAIANSVGQKLDEKVRVSFAPEMLEVWNRMCDRYDGWVPEWDPEEFHNDLKHGLAGGLLALIGSMMVELVVEGAIDAVGEIAEDGFLYYDVYYLPEFTEAMTSYAESGFTTHFLAFSPSTYYLFMVDQEPVVTDSGGYKFTSPFTLHSFKWAPSYVNGWIYNGADSHSSGSVTKPGPFLWCNLFDGPPSSTQTITIEPDIYVGDLPDQIRNGEKDEENLNLPIIDPFKIIQSPETAFEDVTKTLQDLKDGVITHEQYLEKVTADDPTVTPDPSDPTDPSEDPEDIPEEIAPYTFDLRKIFPFCIPFDLYDFLTCLDATPVAPVIHWEIQMPGGGSYPLNLDLSPFDSVAQLLRRLELLVFSIALAIKTRDLIKG